MILPEGIRSLIAERIIRLIVPAIIIISLIAAAAILLFSGQQYHRLLAAITAIVFAALSWQTARIGAPLTGIKFLILCFVLTSLTGIYFSGGIRAPIYSANLIFVIVIVIMYGLKGGVIYTAGMIAVGALAIQLEAKGLLPKVNEPPVLFLLVHYSYMMALSVCFVLIPVRLMLDYLSASQTQSKKLQQAVQERQRVKEELQSILDKTPDIIYRLDTEGKITYISHAISKYGYRVEELLGKSILDLVPPENHCSAERKLIERRTGGRGTRDFEISLLHGQHRQEASNYQASKGDRTTFLVYSDGLYSENTSSPEYFLGTQGIAHDISKLKIIEKKMAFLASLVEQAAEDVVITDPEGIITYVNPRFEEVTGFASYEAIGKTPSILRSDRHDKQFFQDIWQTITAGKIWKGQIWNKTKSGEDILQDVTIQPISDAAGAISGYASIRRDITRQKEFEERIRQSQKMEAIGTLAGGIAHDFNNILSGILGYADLARYDVEDSPKTLMKIDNIISAGKRATDLVAQILSFSRSQKTNPQPVSPQKIADEAMKLLRASLPSHIEIQQHTASQAKIFADPVNIHQIFMNLCTNAGYAMRQSGGILTVKLEDIVLGKNQAEHHIGLMPGKYLKISVLDSGPGIPEQLQERIFNPFFTTKINGEGTGMGLSVVHGIVKNLGGEIILQSEVEKGASFHVYLPVMESNASIAAQASQETLPGGTEKILFVDDEEMQGDLAKKSLSRFGYQISVFSESLAALSHFQVHPFDYDLVITDMTMPEMTGDVLTREIHKVRPDMPVIMCTGFSELMDEEKSRLLNIKALLYKPVIKKDLLETVRSVLDEKTEQSISKIHG